MPKQKLREHLDELSSEFESAGDLDDASRQTLRDLVGDIRAVLDAPEDEPPTAHALSERVQESIREFEVSHPRLAGRLGRVVNLLSAIGI